MNGSKKKQQGVTKPAKAKPTAKSVETKPVVKKVQPTKAVWVKENKTIVILALALVFVAAYVMFSSSIPPEDVSIGDFHEGNGTGVITTKAEMPKMFLIYSGECNNCHAGNSFLLLLRKNGIDFLSQEIEASSQDAALMISQLGIKKLPTLVIDAESISDDLKIRSDENLQISTGSIGVTSLLNFLVKQYPQNAKFDEESNVFVLEELALDGQADRHVDYLLTGMECKPEDEDLFAKVDIFIDPYAPEYIKSKETVDLFKEQFGEQIELNYHFLPTKMSFPLITAEGTIKDLSRHLICAEAHGIFTEAENAFYARYCALNDNNVFDPIEAENCNESEHFAIPLGGDETTVISTIDLGLTRQDLGECIEGAEDRFDADASLAEQLQVYRIPKVVVNCKYSTHVKGIVNALCEADRTLEFCEGGIPNLTEEILCGINPNLAECAN